MAELGSGEPALKKLKREDIPELPSSKIDLLKTALYGLENDVEFGFDLLKITKSNADTCAPFSSSFVKFEKGSGRNNMYYNFLGVFLKGRQVLNSYLEDKTVPEDKEFKIALQRLFQIISNIEDIGQCLDKLITENSATPWTICLVHHLLKELAVNKRYSLDKNSKSKSILCSCCHESIADYGHYDDCSLGNKAVWHGSVDILLGPDTPVYSCQDSEDRDTDGSLSSFEIKDTTSDMSDNNRAHILAETIVISFIQKKNPVFDNYLIPTVAISKNDVLFHFYDSEHDILLESPPFCIKSFDDDGELYYPTILALWLTLNYKTFCTGITKGMKESNFTADFLSSFSNEVKTIYQEHLHFRECGVKATTSSKVRALRRYRLSGLDKSEPYKSSALK